MSRSNPILRNPSVRRFEWKGSVGKLQYYDPEQKQTFDVPMPFRFMVLDQLNMVGGYSKSDKSSIWSNEVRDLKEDVLYVKTKSGPLEAGIYSELIQTIRRGGGFTKSIYIAFMDENGNWQIGNFRASGSALKPWFDLNKSRMVEAGMIAMTRGEQQEAGTGPFFPPVYTLEKCEPAEDQVAIQLDKQLQTYLNAYLSIPKVDEDGRGEPEPETTTTGYATPEQQADFERLKGAGLQNYEDPAPKPGTEDVVIEDIGGEPVNLDDIPF